VTASNLGRSAALSLAAVFAILGCAPVEVPSGDVAVRWIEDDPQTYLAASELVSSRLETDLGPTTPAAVDAWRGHDVRINGLSNGMLEFERTGADPWLAMDTDIDTDRIVAVEVELDNPGSTEVQLFWTGAWQRFSMGRMTRSTSSRRLESGVHLFRFALNDHPEWKGRVQSLRIDPAPGANGSVRLGAVRLFTWEPDSSRASRAAARPWKIDLRRQTKSAMLSPDGAEWDRTFTVPQQATLMVSYGLQAAHSTPVIFRVLALVEGADQIVLMEKSVASGEKNADQWFDASVDLSSLAGRHVTLRLTTDSEEPFTRGFPVWGNPEVVAPAAGERPPNVVVVMLDTLRADRLSCYGHPLETSPHMDRWTSNSAVRFANTVAPAPWTLPSHASIFSGLDAVRHGFNHWGTAPDALEMGAEVFRREGYTTAAITGGGVLHPAMGFAQGFDSFDHWGDPDSSQEVEWVFSNACDWIETHRNRSFFLFVHTYETHAPHRRRQPHFRRLVRSAGITPAVFDLDLVNRPWADLVAQGDHFVVHRPGLSGWDSTLTDRELETVGLTYDSEVATVDAEVGRLLDHLSALGLRGRTIIVVTSDHGEALGEDGRAGHSYLEDYNLMVPLMVELPGAAHAGTVIESQVRLVDLMPTLFDLTDLESSQPVDGRSLLPLITGEVTDFPDHAWAYAGSSNRGLALRMDNTLKYVFPDPAWAEVADHETLHDLIKDPDEEHSLASDDPRLDTLRNTTRETILDQHRGIRLEIRNRTDGTLTGRLTGAWAAHDRVKTADHGARQIRWQPGPASFHLEPGETTTLLFSRLSSSEVGLEADLAAPTDEITGDGVELFDLALLELPAVIHPTPQGWTIEQAFTGELETGFLITRIGDSEPIADAGLPTDAEIIEQLEALGYVH